MMCDKGARSRTSVRICFALLRFSLVGVSWTNIYAAERSDSASAAWTSEATDYQSGGVGWEIVSFDVDLDLFPSTGRIDAEGTLRLRLNGPKSSGPNLRLAQEGMTFDAIKPPDGAIGGIHPEGHEASIRFGQKLSRGAQLDVEVRYHNLDASLPRQRRAVKRFAVSEKGAFASWTYGWYPSCRTPRNSPRRGMAGGTTRITMPADWHSLANGRVISSENADSRRTETWHSAQSVARGFVAGPYTVSTHRVGDIAVNVFVFRRRAHLAPLFAASVAAMVETLEHRLGQYPYESYAIAEIADELTEMTWSGMSEQGYFLAASRMFEAVDGVNVPLFGHELGHSWWGNYILSANPGGAMISEGLAQYCAVLVIEDMEGRRAAKGFMEFSRSGYAVDQCAKGFFEYWRDGKDSPLLTRRPSVAIVRSKGHWILHMLRRRVGDEHFFKTLKRVVRKYALEQLDLAQLCHEFERATPPDAKLGEFFKQWLQRAGAPVLDLAWSPDVHGAEHKAAVHVRQQTEDPYHLFLDVRIDGEDGTRTHRVELSDSKQSFLLRSAGNPKHVILDPERDLLIWRPAYLDAKELSDLNLVAAPSTPAAAEP